MSDEPTSYANMVRETLRDASPEGMTIPEIRDTITARYGNDPRASSISSVLTQDRQRGKGIIRIGNGVWAYRPDHPEDDIGPGPGGNPRGRTPKPIPDPGGEPLEGFADQVDDAALKAVGLTPIARTKDGDWICVDDQGAAWQVTIEARARLL